MSADREVRVSAEARLGSTLANKWRLDALIGLGASAAVYAATHRNGSRVAIKVLHRHLFGSEAKVSRFVREAYTANRIAHAGAVRVFDDDIHSETAFLVMELLDGATVEDHAAACGGKLPLGEVLVLADQVLDVLKAAHALGIIHRDIKPSNLFLERGGRLKVLDFGVARLKPISLDAHTTADGALVGTPAFMAPEQARGRHELVDQRSDVWSVGATLFTLLSGRLVHEASTTTEQLGLAMTVSAPSLRTVAPDLPNELIEVVDRCLQYDPERRYADASSAQAAVRGVAGATRLPSDVQKAASEPNAASSMSSPPSLLLTSRTMADGTLHDSERHAGTWRRLVLVAATVAIGATAAAAWSKQQAGARQPALGRSQPAQAVDDVRAAHNAASPAITTAAHETPSSAATELPSDAGAARQVAPTAHLRRRPKSLTSAPASAMPVAAPVAPEAPDPLDRRH
jgi:serine/threonine-protein kinase